MDNRSCAIVLALTHDYYRDLLILYESIKKRNNNAIIYVAEMGFDEQHLRLLRKLDVRIVTFEPSEITKSTFGKRWPQWAKSHIIKKFAEIVLEENILFMDVDTVVLKKLDEIFDKIDKRFVIVNDYFAPECTMNNPQLYEIFSIPVKHHIAINSGLVGFQKPRDIHILDKWVENTKKIEQNPNLQDYIRLFDQGVLLWALHELDIADTITTNIAWNHPAKRSCYEFTTIPNLIREIEIDNSLALVAHYAGIPKIAHLCNLNDKSCIFQIEQVFKNEQHIHIFCIELEQQNTHNLAETLRRGSKCGTWIRKNFEPTLTEEVRLKLDNQNYWTSDFKNKLKKSNRKDAFITVEINNNFKYFIPEIIDNVENARFVFLLRDPVTLVKSYAESLNQQRPYKLLEIEAYILEILLTIRTVLTELQKLPIERRAIAWVENPDDIIEKFYTISRGAFDQSLCKKWYSAGTAGAKAKPWANEQIKTLFFKYFSEILDLFSEFNITPPFFNYLH